MNQTLSGRLLVVEGPDFVGRSTHIRLLKERLEAHGVAVMTLGLARSKLLGSLIKREEGGVWGFGGHTRALLYATDLLDQIEHSVRPALTAGYVVVADRYIYTPIIRETVRGVDGKWLRDLYAGVPEPTSIILLDAKPRRQLDRLLRDSGVHKLTRYESGSDLGFERSPTRSFLKYQKRLRKKFKEMSDEWGLTIINTEHPVPDVHEEIWNAFLPAVQNLIQEL